MGYYQRLLFYVSFCSGTSLLLCYRERGHYCLYLAIRELFVEKKKLDSQLAEDFKNSMILREEADYNRKFSKEGASVTIESAKKFLKKTKSILKVS
ncbi:MAG: hypothetical protein HQ579_03780 [Candidatus Omnitrophica bacterium]|nr:hypothetical protein [Candidatus Omnitrophota bacterium]